MLLKKYMSRLGIGSTKVDFILDGLYYKSEGSVTGKVLIEGGLVSQAIKRLDVDLICYDNETGEMKEVILSQTILFSHDVSPSEKKEYPISFKLPANLNKSSSKLSYRFVTKLAIENAVDSTDHDEIFIR